MAESWFACSTENTRAIECTLALDRYSLVRGGGRGEGGSKWGKGGGISEGKNSMYKTKASLVPGEVCRGD